jgi:LEA14-like dessication related protein
MASRRTLLAGSVAALVLTSAFAGCAMLPKLEPPKLSVVGITLQSADVFSQRLLVRMRVLNPNPRELPVRGVRYRIEVNDAQLGHGLANSPFVVPALGETEFDVQVTANLAGTLARLLLRRGAKDSLSYRLVGEVSLASGFLRRIPFDERGRVDLQ